MASISNAITALASFGSTVTGITHSYDLNAIPEKITRDKLPCLIVYPEAGNEAGFKTSSFMGNSAEIEFDVNHLLLYNTADAIDVRKALPGLITLFDNYLTALKAQPFLGSTNAPPIHRATKVTPAVGIVEYAGIKYHSILFKHHLCIYL